MISKLTLTCKLNYLYYRFKSFFYNIRAFNILDSCSKIKFSHEITVELELIEAFFLYLFISDDDIGSVSIAKSVSTGLSII